MKKKKRRCLSCGARERTFAAGLYTNLSPFTQVCADCINRAIGRKPKRRR